MGHIFLAAGRPMEARKAARLILEKDPSHTGAYQLLAAVQVQEKNLPAAIRTLRKACEIAPHELMPNLFLAHLLAVDGQVDESEKRYLEILSIHPEHSTGYLELSKLYGRNGRWEDARRIVDLMSVVTEIDFPRLSKTARFFERRKKLDLAETLYIMGAKAAVGDETGPLMELGRYYARRGDRFKALSTMQQALDRKKGDANILTEIGRLHLQGGDLRTAESSVDAALASDASYTDAIQLKGEILFARQEYASAMQQFDLTISLDEENYRAYFFKALCLRAKGVELEPDVDLFRAAAGLHDDADKWVAIQIEENLLEALDLKPDLLRAKLMLAEIYLRNGLTDKAREQINSAREQSPGRMETLTLLGSLRLMEGDLAGAERLCKDVLSKDPKLAGWHTRLGIVYLRMRRPEQAVASFRDSLDLNPRQLGTLKLLTDVFVHQKAFAEAIRETDRRKQALGNNPMALAAVDHLQGIVYMAWNKHADARRRFDAAIAAAPRYIAPHMGLAALSRSKNDIDGAISRYETVLSMDADYLPACMALGEIHYRKGDRKKAEIYFRRALEIQPNFAPAANNLAYILSSDDEALQEALNLARSAVVKMPDDPTARDTLGWIFYRMGQYVSAEQELTLSLNKDPNSALTQYHLGLVRYRQERYDEAREYFRKALELDADFEGADEALSMLE